MKLSSNIIKFHNELGLKKTIDVFSEAGFEEIDFNVDLEEYHTDMHDENFYRSIKSMQKTKELALHRRMHLLHPHLQIKKKQNSVLMTLLEV